MGSVTEMATKIKKVAIEKPPPPKTLTAAEFKVLRERLGLPASWVARKLSTPERTLSRWETGAHPVRQDAVDLLMAVKAETNIVLNRMLNKHKPGAVLRTYRFDEHVDFVGRSGPYPASWHRALIGRLAALVDDDVSITYDD